MLYNYEIYPYSKSKSVFCEICENIFYCSDDCKSKDLRFHKKECLSNSQN